MKSRRLTPIPSLAEASIFNIQNVITPGACRMGRSKLHYSATKSLLKSFGQI